MKIARIENGTVVETRDMAIEDVPEHKRVHWRTIVDQPPEFDSRVERRVKADWQITATEAVRQYTIEPHSRDMMVRAVKAEAQRRIVMVTGATDLTGCLVKQMNAQMRAAELINIKAEGGSLTVEQQAESDTLKSLANAIKYIRARSNDIEALDPIPADFAADVRWA